ncbi:MAG: M48 family metalloprotease [Sulfurimonas sp.]|nr:M48 family metalloprotease [Sulfurimonas sp.]
MKKVLMQSTVLTVSSIVLSGCMGGTPTVKAPVTDREQSLNPKVMNKIAIEYEEGASKGFAKREKSAKTVLIEKAPLNKLTKAKDLEKLMAPLLAEASKIFKSRGLSKEIIAASPKFLQGNTSSLNITLYSHTDKKGNKNFNASYTPFNDIYIQNLDLSTEAGKSKAQFVLAHELGHAIALHVTEDETQVQELLDGGSDTANLALDITANEFYATLSPTAKKLLSTSTPLLSAKLNITQKDYDIDTKLMELRQDSFAAKIAIKSGDKTAMHAMGIGFEIPQKSRILIKTLLNSGLDASGISTMISNSTKVVMQSAVLVVHSQDQELEADKIAQKILSNLKTPIKDTACALFHNEKPAGFFDAHPSHQDRLANLNIENCK